MDSKVYSGTEEVQNDGPAVRVFNITHVIEVDLYRYYPEAYPILNWYCYCFNGKFNCIMCDLCKDNADDKTVRYCCCFLNLTNHPRI